MIPYNEISYLSHSQEGRFNSYIGKMKTNDHQVSTCLEEQYISEGSRFIAVSIDETQRDTTLFHFTLAEINTLDSMRNHPTSIETCSICSTDRNEGISLRSVTFSKIATFHDTKEICLACIDELQTALEIRNHKMETELVRTHI